MARRLNIGGRLARRRVGNGCTWRESLPRQFGLLAGQHVQGLLAHDDLSRGRREHRQQTDVFLISARLIPGNPDAVGSAQCGCRVVFGELFRGEGELAVGLPVLGRHRFRVVIGVHDELAFHGNRLVFGVVEIEPASKTADRRLSHLSEHIGGPDGRHASGRFVLAFFHLGRPRHFGKPIGIDCLASAQEQDGQEAGNRQSLHDGLNPG